MKFNYQARTKEGQTQSGVVEASSREAALNILQKHGLYVTILEEAKAPVYAKKIRLFERISRKDIVVFNRQLAIMVKSNVPLVDALESLANQVKNRSLKETILKIAEEVEGGTSLSQALSSHPKIFSPFYVSMVKSGEASGKLSESLQYLADHSEREYDFVSKIIGAMIYPLFIVVVFVIVLIIIITVAIPGLSQVLEETGAETPFFTKLIIDGSIFLKKWWWVFLVAISIPVTLVFRYFRTDEGKKILDRASLRLPLIGDFLKKISLARFAENLSTLISGGIPIARALEITGEIVGNDVYKTVILETRDGVRRGEAMSSILSRFPETFPPLFIQMIFVGEKTGQLDQTLLNVVDFYQKEVDRTLDSLINLLEPIMIIGLGIVVAGVVASVLLPLYQTLGTM